MDNTTLNITASNFNDLLTAHNTLMVDFWAPWCGPCLQLGPVIDALSKDYQDRAAIGKLNVDENAQLARSYGISSIPTVLFFKEGKLADKITGAVPRHVLEAKLQEFINK